MSISLICNHKSDDVICKDCKHGEEHSPITTTPFNETCNMRRSVCVDKHVECLCVEVIK